MSNRGVVFVTLTAAKSQHSTQRALSQPSQPSQRSQRASRIPEDLDNAQLPLSFSVHFRVHVLNARSVKKVFRKMQIDRTALYAFVSKEWKEEKEKKIEINEASRTEVGWRTRGKKKEKFKTGTYLAG